MESYRVVLTFESVNDILWCDHSNGTYVAVLSHSNICFTAVYTKKLGIFVDWWILMDTSRMGAYIKKWMDLKGRYTLGDKLQQQVAATDHSVCSGSATSCSNTSQRQIASCVETDFHKISPVQQNFVAATSRTNSLRFDFLQHVAATKFCCRDKDFTKCLQYTRSDLSLWHVVATCCCNLSLSVYRH